MFRVLLSLAIASIVLIAAFSRAVAAPSPSPSPSPTPSASPSVKPTAPPEIFHVTINRIEQRLAEVPQSISIVTPAQIQNTPTQELDQILQVVPGVNLLDQPAEQVHPTADSIGMRGLGGAQNAISRALVMIDGVPINDPFFGYIQWGRVPLDWVDHVEILRGGGSPLWGNFAMGGVINIITREPSATHTRLDLSDGSYGTYNGSSSVSYAPPQGHGLSLQAGFACNGTDGYNDELANAVRPFDTPVSYHDCDTHLGAGYRDNHFKIDGAYTYHENQQQLGTPIDSNFQHYATYSLTAKNYVGDNASLTAAVFHTDSAFLTNNSVSLDGVTQYLNNVHSVPSNDYGGSLIWSKSSTGGTLTNYTIGGDYHGISGADYTNYYDSTGSNIIRSDVGTGKQQFFGVFGRASFVPAKSWELVGSLRYQMFQNLEGFDGTLGGVGAVPNSNTYNLSPRVDLRYTVRAGLAVRAAYYTSFRAPDLADLYYGFAANDYAFLPNPELVPETLSGGEVGVDVTNGRLRSQFTIYRTNVHNMITVATITPPPQLQGFYVQQYVNAAQVLAQGFEADMAWKMSPYLTTDLGYTYAYSIFQNNPAFPSSVGYQLPDVPQNSASARFTYTLKNKASVAMNFRYVSKTNWYSLDHSVPPPPAYPSADPLFVTDLTVAHPVVQATEAYLQFSNLFNSQYIANPGAFGPAMYGPPFQVFAGIRTVIQ